MKSYIILLIILFSCKKSQNSKHNQMDNTIISQTPYYAIEIDALPKFSVLVNDVKIVSHNDRGSLNSVYLLNKEILSKGEQVLKLNIISDQELSETDEQYFKFKIFKYENFDSDDKTLILDAKPKFKQKTKVYSQILPFIANVPYKLKGWSNSVKLIDENKEDLLKEVLEFYNNTHGILNSGKSIEYLNLVSKRNEETAIAFYNNPGVLQEKEELAQRVKGAMGKMNPLKDFTLKYYGNGRIVTLENKDGDSPLYYSTEDYDDFFSIQLHRPKAGEPLEIIR